MKVENILGTALWAGALFLIFKFPVFNWMLALLLILYSWCLIKYPQSFLFFFPVLLSCFNFYPWSGRLLIEVPDIFIMAAIGVYLLKKKIVFSFMGNDRKEQSVLLFLISIHICSIVIAFMPFNFSGINPFFDYLSPLNSLRIAKGFFWALVLLPVIREQNENWELLVRGFVLALLIVSTIAIRERFLYSGIFDFSDDFRSVSTFASMHVGGGHIGAFLTLSIPFAIVGFFRDSSRSFRTISLVSFVLGLYTLLSTVARAAWLGSSISILCCIACLLVMSGQVLRRREFIKKYFILLVILLLLAEAVAGLTNKSFLIARLKQIPRDIKGRIEIVKNAVHLMDNSLISSLLGMGAGSFPRYYIERNEQGMVPNKIELKKEGKNYFLRNTGRIKGPVLQFGQVVHLDPDREYIFRVRARSKTGSGISFQIHEKTILYSNGGIELEGFSAFSPDWQIYSGTFSSSSFSTGPFLFSPRLEFFLYNFKENSLVDLDDFQILDSSGKNMIQNGDFNQRGDHWIFENGNHEIYQAKNAYAGVYFEQGVVGLLGIFALVGLSVMRMFTAMRRSVVAIAAGSGVAGFLALMVFDNPLTVPRLSILFFTLLFIISSLGYHRQAVTEC